MFQNHIAQLAIFHEKIEDLNNGRTRVRRYHGECNLAVCTIEQQRLVWWFGALQDAICDLASWCLLNSNCCTREVSEPKVLSLIQATPHPIFQQDNARSYVARIVQVFFEERRVSLPHRLESSSNISPFEYVWVMGGLLYMEPWAAANTALS